MTKDKLSDILNQIEAVTKKPEKYLCVQNKEAQKIKELTKNLYNFSKQREPKSKKPKDVLNELIITDFDEEQIWQQVELQNNSICNILVTDVAQLLAKKNDLKFPIKINKPKIEQIGDEKEEEDYDENEEEEDFDEEDEEEENFNFEEKVGEKAKKPVKSSIVDDKFFKLHEMEQFLEKMEKENSNDDDDKDSDNEDEEIDYFDDKDDEDLSEDPENKLHYNDFFDQPNDEEAEKPGKKKRRKTDLGNKRKTKKVKFTLEKGKEENEEEDNNSDEGEVDEENDNENFNKDFEEEEEEEEDYEEASGLKGKNKMSEKPSTFEARQERLKSRISALEEEALREKPWQLKGEVTATTRPQNSLLQEYVEFDMASKPAPVITEKSTFKLEDIILQRIKDKVWDDVVRKIKPVEGDKEYRKKLVLDQEKSKLSLAEIYEKEYLKQLEDKTEDPLEKQEVEPPEHQEIRSMMKNLFSNLDALCNFHFTPRQAIPEVKVLSNLPAITMEEVAPVATSDAALLAPEEVKAKSKGNLIGKSERTPTDKKRERRRKKLKQKLNYAKKKLVKN